jgi:hypothetical protein
MGTHVSPRQLVGDDAPACSIWYIGSQLGRRDHSPKRLIAYVSKLIDDHGFPKPYPREQRGESALTLEVGKTSTWPKAAVDHWLTGWLPPDAGAALDAAQRREAADAMDERAANLQLGRPRAIKLGNGRTAQMLDGGRP